MDGESENQRVAPILLYPRFGKPWGKNLGRGRNDDDEEKEEEEPVGPVGVDMSSPQRHRPRIASVSRDAPYSASLSDRAIK